MTTMLEPDDVTPLWRELLGQRLRMLRARRGETLLEVARRAGVAPQYLSEVERGMKDPSSEMIAAIVGALDASLLDLTVGVARELRAREVVALTSIARISGASDAIAGSPTTLDLDGGSTMQIISSSQRSTSGHDVQLALAA